MMIGGEALKKDCCIVVYFVNSQKMTKHNKKDILVTVKITFIALVFKNIGYFWDQMVIIFWLSIHILALFDILKYLCAISYYF